MSNQYSLVIYEIRATLRNTFEEIGLQDIENDEGLVLDQIRSAIANSKTEKFLHLNRRLLVNSHPESNDVDLIDCERSISAVLKYGFFGDISDIEDDTDNLVFQKDGSHTEYIPMFAGFYAKSEDHKSYLVLSTYGKSGIKTVLSNFLYSKIFKKFSNYTFRIVPFWPSEAKDAFYKSDVEAVTITSLKSFKDSSDYKLAEANQDYEVTTQYRKVKKSKKSYKRAKMKISKEIRDDVKNFTDDPDVLDVELTVSFLANKEK